MLGENRIIVRPVDNGVEVIECLRERACCEMAGQFPARRGEDAKRFAADLAQRCGAQIVDETAGAPAR